MNEPVKISVLMSVYNNGQYLKEAVESILDQTFKDFEFIITDDCSTDNSLKILKEYQKNDSRILLIENTVNSGLTANLNQMLKLAQGKYIARMDSDDISLPERFDIQYKYMEANPEIGVLGTHSKIFGKNIKPKVIGRPLKHEEIRTALLYENIIIHSTVFLRKSVLTESNIKYDENFRIIQDYDLWSRLVFVTGFAILPDVLVQYRMSDTNLCAVSSQKENYREDTLKNIFRYQLTKNKFEFDDDRLATHIFIGYKRKNNDPDILSKAENWLEKLKNHNDSLKSFDCDVFNEYISRYWFTMCTKSSSAGISSITRYYRSPLAKYYNPGITMRLKFLLKCLINY